MTAKLPQRLAIGLIQDAHAYVECARLLDQHHGGEPGTAKYIPPTYFLLCHAMELALPEEVLRYEIVHKIDVAFRDARDRGFAPADDRFSALVQGLAPYHRDHFFRYREAKGGRGLERLGVSEAADIIESSQSIGEVSLSRTYHQRRQGR
jgi:hypothetical protein